jgi:squalene synthase HpnC
MRTDAGFPLGRHDEAIPAASGSAASSSAAPDAPALRDARKLVQGTLRRGQENFTILSHLVPGPLRDDYAAVYAFCRVADDLADDRAPGESAPEGNARALAALRRFREGLHWCAAGASGAGPAHLSLQHRALFIALHASMRARRLSREPFDHLLDAFEQDQIVTRYETWDQVLAYCTRSANPVGRMILALHGYGDGNMGPGTDDESRRRLAASDAICTGLQLANFWQDVRRDLLERDRVYVPIADVSVTSDNLRAWLDRQNDQRVRRQYADALRTLVARSWDYFHGGKPLAGLVDRRTAWSTWLFRRAGEEVLRQIERNDYTTLWERVKVPKATRVGLLLQAVGGYILGQRPSSN